MSDLQKRIADALYQAALEGDESPKMLLSQRVVEILVGESPLPAGIILGERPRAYDAASLRAARLAKGWTQAELAAKAGTSQQTIDRLERGAAHRSDALPAIAAALAAEEAISDEGALRVRIRERGINQSELARRLGVHPSAINKMLKGQRRIKVDEAAIIRTMLDEAA